MPNWSSFEEILRDADVFMKLIFVLFGLYVWEVITTANFDFEVFTGRRRFRWALTFYFAARYCMLMALIAVIVVLTVRSEINCQAVISFGQWAGNTAIAASTTCLMFRTIAIWKQKLSVIVPLVVMSLAQWGLLYHGIVTVKAAWYPVINSCNVTGTSAVFLNVMYFYTMGFDFVILVLSTVGLLMSSTRSTLWKLLFYDGIIFFTVTFAANAVAAVLNVLDLNPVMNIIATVPAAAVSTIAATRAVVRLIQLYDVPGAATFGATSSRAHGGGGGGGGGRNDHINSPRNRNTLAKFAGGQTAITMDTLTRDDMALAVRVQEDLELEAGSYRSGTPITPTKSRMDLEAGGDETRQ